MYMYCNDVLVIQYCRISHVIKPPCLFVEETRRCRMNGISVNSKQGSESHDLGFTGTGESPALLEDTEDRSANKRVRKAKEKRKKTISLAGLKGSIGEIQDGAQQIGDTLSDFAQLENIHDPPVLCIPDTAADNETISRLLGGQGASLLDLGGPDHVNIDFIPENVDYSRESAMESVHSGDQVFTSPAASSGIARGRPPEPRAQTRSPVRHDTAGSGSGDMEISYSVPTTSVALDLSMKSDKIRSLDTGRINLKLAHSRASVNNLNKTCKISLASPSIVTSSRSSNVDSDLITVATVSPKSPSLSNGREDDYSGMRDAEVTDPTGDSLLLNIAQVNSSSPSPSQDPEPVEDNASPSPTIAATTANPLMYIITSRDKNTGLTQRFRVTVDPEAVMYIPVMNIGSDSEAAVDEVSIIPCDASADKEVLGTATVGDDGELHVASGSIPVTLLNSGSGMNMTAIPNIGKDDLTQMTGDMISCSLILEGNADGNSSTSVENQIVRGKAKERNWSKKTPQRKKEAQEVMVCDHPGCGATIIGKSKYRIHKLGHNDNRPHKCPHEGCDWSFPSLYKLRRHISGHTGAKPFVCGMDGCGKQFSTIYNLKMHLNSHFRTTVEMCDVEGCNKIFASAALLKIHKRKHFEEQRLRCEFPGCTKTFTTSSALGSHQRVHVRDATNYPCPFEGCPKVYDKACRLKLHMRSHTGERPFKCTFEGCDWAFTCIQKLTRHLVRHTGERKYQCKFPGCGKLFTRLEHLKSHEVFHSGEKPYACKEEGCNARFAARSSLYMHQKRHLAGKPLRDRLLFSCPLDGCDMSFASKLGLKSHIIKGHGIPLPFTGGAGDFELIGLGNDQLHSPQADPTADPSTDPKSDTQAETVTAGQALINSTSTTTVTRVTQASVLPAISPDLMASSLLQAALTPAPANIPLSGLSSSHDEAASILASGLLQNQYLLQRPQVPVSLKTPKDQVLDPVPSTSISDPLPTTPKISTITVTPSSILTIPSPNPAIPIPTPAAPTLTATTQATTPTLPTPPTSSSSLSAPVGLVPASTSQPVSNVPKVCLENRSGSARTDYRGVTAKNPLPADSGEHFKRTDHMDVDSWSQSDSSESSEGSLHQAAFIPQTMMTSASLTLRDPATGTRYIQTQLLQDDPPDMPDMGFHLTSHDSTDQSPLSTSLSVSAMLDEGSSEHTSDADFMTGDASMDTDMVTSFRGSTINLQDLE